jgi:general secretion pathway protein L
MAYRIQSSFLLPSARWSTVEYELTDETSVHELFSLLPGALKAKPDDNWYLGLPLKYFSIVNFSLPKAAEADFDQAVRYSLMRHIPFDVSDAYIHYHQLSSNETTLEVSAITANKAAVQPFLQALEWAGISLTALFPSIAYWAMQMDTSGVYFSGGAGEAELLVWKNGSIPLHIWNSAGSDEREIDFLHQSSNLLENMTELPSSLLLWESDLSATDISRALGVSFEENRHISDISPGSMQSPSALAYAIDMVPRSVLKRQRKARRMQTAAMVIFCLSLLAVPMAQLAGKKGYLESIESKISRVRDRAEQLSSLRQENQRLTSYIQGIAQKERAKKAAIDVLKEATEVVPESAWLYSYSYTRGKVYMQGEADSATAVLEALENSPLFREAQFDSPVKKSGAKDRFKIVATVVQ